jgi:uncharacterized alpha-E superfamily protein
MSRYIERAQNVARFVDVNLNLILDLPMGGAEQWSPLVSTTGDDDVFYARYGQATRENVIRFLIFDFENPNSIVACLRAARENARSVRESITSEMWEQVNRFYLSVTRADQDRAMRALHEFLAEVKQMGHLFAGITDATMSRGEGWHFSRLGAFIERADKTSRILDVKYYILLPNSSTGNNVYDGIQWSAVLNSASGLEMYRKRHGRIDPRRVVDFLVLDREFPRAVHFCLIHADASLHAITGSPVGGFTNEAERRLGQLRADLAYLQVDEILDQGLHEFLDSLQQRLNKVGGATHDVFFAYRPVAEALTEQ